MGVRDLTHGFMGGLKGIFVDPIRGAQEEGVAGLVKGARKGIMSALVKPTVCLSFSNIFMVIILILNDY